MNNYFIPAIVALVILVFVAVLVRRKTKLKLDAVHQRKTDAFNAQETATRQKAVMKELHLLGSLTDDKTLSSSELEIKCKQSLANIESYNQDGSLSGMLNDLTQHVMAEVESRRSLESK